MVLGPSEEMIERIIRQDEAYGMQRYTAQIDFGGIPFEQQIKAIEVLETQVLPEIKNLQENIGRSNI